MAKAKKELAEKDELIAKLKDRIRTLKAEKAQLQERHKSEMERLRNGYQKEIDKVISRAEVAERQSKEKDSVINRQNQRIDQLDRKANPQRYRLSSGAELVRINVPNYRNPSLHIWTRVGNTIFEPQEQVNEIQANLLGVAFELAIGGPAQVHVGTGGGGSSPELPWGEQKNRSRRSK